MLGPVSSTVLSSTRSLHTMPGCNTSVQKGNMPDTSRRWRGGGEAGGVAAGEGSASGVALRGRGTEFSWMGGGVGVARETLGGNTS